MKISFLQMPAKNMCGLVILAFAATGPNHSARADPEAEVPSSGKWSTSSSGCKIWDTNPDVGKTLKWSGACVDGYAAGPGTVTWSLFDVLDNERLTGTALKGRIVGSVEINYSNGSKYVGALGVDGLFKGQGTMTFANGNKYAGLFQKGLLNGQATVTFASGGTDVGEFKSGKLDGQGTRTFPNGDKYVGLFKEDQFEGQGTLTAADGGKYVGLFKGGQLEGQGVYTAANGNKYAGLFQKGLLNGQATVTFASGGTDVGEFKNNKLDGQGTQTFPNGEKYVGLFKEGQYEGQGVYTAVNGSKYVGLFKNGALDGQGTIIFPNGSNYTGQIKGRVAEGIGTFAGIDGVRLTGQFRANFIEGDGVRILPNGERYVGQFHLNKGKGRGKRVYPDGRFYEGLFEDNLENGQGALYGADGNVIFDGFWRDGAYLGPIDPAIIAARKKAGGRGRFALLIGNSEYREVGVLLNPSRDVDLIEGSLKMAGFEVTVVKNGTLNDLQKTLSAFRLMAAGAEAAVVYYAGHGVEINGDNLLIPVDAKINTIQSTAETSLNVGRVLESISSAKISVVILDACRDNPFPQNGLDLQGRLHKA